jgi:intracellular sulfur oxidation DsrE/DsrF family protein
MSKKVVTMAVAGLAMLSSSAFAANCLNEPYKNGEQNAFLPYEGSPHATGTYMDADAEFGPGALDNTECVGKQGKLVLQVDNHLDSAGKAPWLATYGFFLRNYEIQGMEAGKDVEVAVVLSSKGALLGMKAQDGEVGKADNASVAGYDNAANVAKVQDALARGFKVYVCQTAARGLGIKQEDLIDGVKFTPGGHLKVADLQMDGYAHLIYK